MKIQNQLVMLTLMGMLIACDNNSAPTTFGNKITKASWMIGQWQNSSPQGVLSENWKQENDSMFSGESFFVVGKDTLFSEAIQIIQEKDELFYIPTVPDQNNGLPVRFKLTTESDSILVFENPDHDFPQRIKYMRIGKDSIVAEISGQSKGESKAEQFAMTRVK